MRTIIGLSTFAAALLFGCGRDDAERPAPPSASNESATAAPAMPVEQTIRIWRGFLSDDPAEMAEALDALATFEPGSLRAVRYSAATVEGQPGIQIDDYAFELGVPPQTRAWHDALQSQVAERGPPARAALLIRLDSLLAGVMESWRKFESTRQYVNAARLRAWCNQQLAELGEVAAHYRPREKSERLELLAKRASLLEKIDEAEIP